MSLIVVGLNHRTAPVDVLERAAVSRTDLPKALLDLTQRDHLSEVVLLSTCNRTEVYARCTKFHAAVDDVRLSILRHAGLSDDVLSEHLYTYYDDAAVAHLFGVAAGVDSMIVGEGEILGQVRDAWLAAEDEGCTGTALARTFRQSVEVGKRARTETTIGQRKVSIASAAVELASRYLTSLEGKRILVLGAGEVGEGMAVALAGSSVRDVIVANRSPERADALATRVGGRAVSLDDARGALHEVDVLLASTAATDLMLERSDVESLMQSRPHRPLLVVDVAVPRDVDPGVAEVEGVTLLDIDDLKAFAEDSMEQRRGEVGTVRAIITDELDRYRAERSAREVAPLITVLRERAEEIRRAELARWGSQLDVLDPAQREAIDAVTRGLVNKLLHEPTVRVKEAAGSDNSEIFVDALRALFDLPHTPAGDDLPDTLPDTLPDAE
ncbi:MAG: glutamyl-tRNA reductase [Acidimicrobiia bacterium]|nr:glutamyl-tRNA reductase [Acidimicrobiia bacterium]